MYTYPNQKIMHINKPSYKRGYLSVGIDEWQEAYKCLSPSGFALYLYLSSNANGFNLALSQKAVQSKIDMSKTTYHRAVNELEENGYVTLLQGNVYNFHTKPSWSGGVVEEILKAEEVPGMEQYQDWDELVPETELSSIGNDTVEFQNGNRQVPKSGREINNLNTISNLTNADTWGGGAALGADAPERRGDRRELEDLSDEELESIIQDYRGKVSYRETAARLGLTWIDKESAGKAKSILNKRWKDDEMYEYKREIATFGIAEKECEEVYFYISETKCGMLLAKNLKSYLTGSIENRYSAKELLDDYRANRHHSRYVFNRVVPRLDKQRPGGYTKDDYFDYLFDCIENPSHSSQYKLDIETYIRTRLSSGSEEWGYGERQALQEASDFLQNGYDESLAVSR